MTLLKSIIKADYLQRTRSYAFLITMLVSICMAYTFVPAAGAKYSTVRIGDYLGESNGAWIGHTTAIMSSTFLWLIGFYLVNNGINRDRETGVGQIVATTSISNFKYLLAKALSNFLVLLTIAVVAMIMALGLVLIRGSQFSFNPLQFLLPYFVATIPCIFCVSVLAVFAEVILGKYPNVQNVVFFFLFPVIIQSPNAWFDVLGTKQLFNGMIAVVNTEFNQTVENVGAGFLLGDQSKNKYFLFEGSNFTSVYFFSRLMWIGFALVLLYGSSLLFHRFDVKEKFAMKKKKKIDADEPDLIPIKEIHLATLPVAAPAYGIWPFVKTELLMLFRTGPRWFWLVNIGGFIALFLLPLSEAHKIGLPILWFLQINRWAGIATKEKFNGTHYFTYAAYKPLQRLLTAQVIAGSLLAITLASPLTFRFAIAGNYSTAISIFLGAVLIIALSVSSGIILGGKRFFEIAFFMLSYMNISAMPELDYFGAFNQGTAYITLMAVIICVLFTVAFVGRGYEIRNQ